MNLNAALDVRNILEQAKAEKIRIEITLRGGKGLAGLVGELGDHNVVLTQLAGKEFYDAFVRLDEIVAVEARVRGK